MPKKIRIVIISAALIILAGTARVNAQLLDDTTALPLVRKDIGYIYNLQFNDAGEFYNKITRLYPAHPIVYLLRGLMTYWENYPLLNVTPAHVSFEEDMRECIKLSEKNDNQAFESEYLLANLCARGMLLSYYSDNDLIMEVTPLTISTYKYLRRAFGYVSQCSDLYYFTGTYKYYREAFPKVYPVYRSLAFLFPRGDMEKGLKELQIAAVKSTVLNAESLYLLTWIYLGFENKPAESTYYSRILYEKFPDNELYLETYIRNLLLQKNYDKAETLMSALSEEGGNKFYQAQLMILKGILNEKKYNNKNAAESYYNKGISNLTLFGDYGNEFASYGYFGLSRISDDNGEKHTRRIYRKEALKLSDFKKINFDK